MRLPLDQGEFLVDGKDQFANTEVIKRLSPLLTEERYKKIEQVLSGRTFDVVPVLEDIYDRGNISAVMRSAEAFGFFNFNIIDNKEQKFKAANRVTQGTDKWLDIHNWKSTSACLTHLKSNGYKVYATHLDATAKSIFEVDWTGKVAVVLGNEKEGVSQDVLDQCDGRVIIPMQGFAQSFNISVAGALMFFHIYSERVKRHGKSGNLTAKQQELAFAHMLLEHHNDPYQLLREMRARD